MTNQEERLMPSSHTPADTLRSRRRTRGLLFAIAVVTGIAVLVWVMVVDVEDGLWVATTLTALCAYTAVQALVVSREIHRLKSEGNES